MTSIKRRPGGAILLIAACAAAFLLFAGSAKAATEVYPAGGGTFASDLQGWQVTDASCSLPVICTASGAHDASAGNPPGSATAKTTVILGLINLISSTVVFESPEFAVADDGSTATLRLDRQFVPSQVAVPGATYIVTLKDITGGTDEVVHTETLTAASPTFVAQEVAVDVTAGSTYAIEIEAETSATVEFGLLGGANLRFDNVALSVETPDPPVDPPVDPPSDPGADDENGNNNSTDSSKNSSSSQQQTVHQGTTTGVVRNGRQVLVKLSCPARAKKACRITAQGKLAGKLVTKRRTVKVAKGKSRIVSLPVKPRFRETVAERKRLQIVQRVKTGKKTRTFTRSRPLIQRG